jgi:hypothetical protein
MRKRLLIHEENERREKLDFVQRLLWFCLGMLVFVGGTWLARDWLIALLGGWILFAILAGWVAIMTLAWAGGEITAYLLGLVLVLVLLGGCTDPEKVARARAIESGTNIQATQSAVGIQATATAVSLNAVIEAGLVDEREAFWSTAWDFGAVAVLVGGAAGLGCVIWVMVAESRARSRQAGLRARTLHVSRDTRLLPLLVSPDGQSVTNLNTGESRPLWALSSPDSRLLAIDHDLRRTGLMVDGLVEVAKQSRSGDAADGLARGWVVLGGRKGSPGLSLPSPEEDAREFICIEGGDG